MEDIRETIAETVPKSQTYLRMVELYQRKPKSYINSDAKNLANPKHKMQIQERVGIKRSKTPAEMTIADGFRDGPTT